MIVPLNDLPRLLVLVAVFALSACDRDSPDPPTAPAPAIVDLDGDATVAVADCNDGDPSLWRVVTVFDDLDGDNVGTEPGIGRCMGATPPARTALSAGDCDDANAAWWTMRAYEAVDADEDGRVLVRQGTVCSGSSLRPGYLAAVGGASVDCDDGDPAAWRMAIVFADEDSDHVGAGSALSRCIGATAPPGTSLLAGDCADNDATLFQTRPYGALDRDADAHRVPSAGSVCSGTSLPPGYFATNVNATGDCDDADASAWRTVTVFEDADADHVGVGAGSSQCIGVLAPAGTALVAGDCAAADPTRFRLLPYAAVDADSDGYDFSSAGTVCSGNSLPPGFLTGVKGAALDCDDANSTTWRLLATFADADADGFGAGAGTSRCVGTFPPAGTAFVSGDCAVNDPALFAELPYSLDQDNDGHVSAALGTVCTGGALPPGLLSLGSAAQDCDDQDAVSWRNVAIYQDRDGDGVGSGAFAVTCMGDLVPAGYSGLGYDPLDVPGDPDSLHLSNLELDVAILIVP